MAERFFKVETLIRVQQLTWYVTALYFAVVVGLYLLDIALAGQLAYYGLVWILAATMIKLVVMAERFRLAGMRRFWALCYLLVLILASIAIVRYLL